MVKGNHQCRILEGPKWLLGGPLKSCDVLEGSELILVDSRGS